ncbi:MAG TPA: hypothetical protein ENG75_06660 [Nitrospirae bacterium]|nr:hypothetical protein [Gammaproteobacteria bacterium]HDK17605.1 hypothetical protein [Nitrospirota bacterium]
MKSKAIISNKLHTLINVFTVCLGIGLLLFASADVSAEFVPNEELVSSQPDMIDPEYDQSTSQFVWADSAGSLWIGKWDRKGMFKPSSGKAILVDPDAASVYDLKITFNGPEWIQSAEGPEIVYTKFLPGMPHVPETGRLALAQLGPDGQWTYKFLEPDDYPRNGPYASEDKCDASPRIAYVDPDLNHYWRDLNDPATEELIPLMTNLTKRSVRWVQGARVAVYQARSPINDSSQVFTYDVDTKELEQITFDSGRKDNNPPWMWQAPEYDNDYIILATVVNEDNSEEFRIYRQLDINNDGNMVWSNIFTAAAPPDGEIGSPEPFTYLGHSYIFFQMTFEQEYSTSIWLANIDSADPFLRKVSDDSLLRHRFDPEVVIIYNKGPYIYYNRVDRDPECTSLCYEGIFRAYTGLSPN